MIRITELVKTSETRFSEKVTFLSKETIISVTEDASASKEITEQRGASVVVSRINLKLPEGTKTVFALGAPDAIMSGQTASTQRGILYG